MKFKRKNTCVISRIIIFPEKPEFVISHHHTIVCLNESLLIPRHINSRENNNINKNTYAKKNLMSLVQ